MYQVEVHERLRGVIGTVTLPFVPRVGDLIDMSLPFYIRSVVISCDINNQFDHISVYGEYRDWSSYR